MKPAPEMTLDEETWELAQGGDSAAAAQADGSGTEADIEVAKLAKLTAAQYERKRKDAAKRLNMRASVLDNLVHAARKKTEKEDTSDIFAPIEPSATPIEGDALFCAVEARIRQHIAADDAIFTVATLWIGFAWAHDAFIHSPILLATSKEPDSGKTTLLELLKFLVPRGLSTTEITAAALYRVVDQWRPTLIVDEADVIFRQNDELRAVINSGWTRGSGVIRCNPDTLDPELFPTFGPKVVGMKGLKIPDTTLSRSIVLQMKRKRQSEVVGDFLHDDDAQLRMLRGQLARWAADNRKDLSGARPAVPDGFHNRLACNWRPLFAIAHLCGGEWPARAHAAAQAMSKVDIDSLYIQALAVIRAMFDEREADRVFSQDIVDGLLAVEDGPWKYYGGKDRDKPITQNGLARLLKPIAPDTIRIGEGRAKGYYRHQFEEEFERYLSGIVGAEDPSFVGTPQTEPCNRDKCDEIRTSSDFEPCQPESLVTVANRKKPNNDGVCHGCTVGKGGNGQNTDLGTESGLSPRRIRELADWFEDQGYQRHCKGNLDTAELDADLRLILREEVAFPEHVEIEFERVMQLVFEV
jgi:putative DNA primase/helicase